MMLVCLLIHCYLKRLQKAPFFQQLPSLSMILMFLCISGWLCVSNRNVDNEAFSSQWTTFKRGAKPQQSFVKGKNCCWKCVWQIESPVMQASEKLDMSMENIPIVIATCCVLHNEIHGETFNENWMTEASSDREVNWSPVNWGGYSWSKGDTLSASLVLIWPPILLMFRYYSYCVVGI